MSISLLPTDCAFLVGAGISVDSGLNYYWYQSWIHDAIEKSKGLIDSQILEKIKGTLYKSHVDHLPANDYNTKLRFEAVVEVLSKLETDDLNVSPAFDCIKEIITAGTNQSISSPIEPCYYHYILAELLKRGAVVLTTNFDCLIEKACSCSQINYSVEPIITEDDYRKVENFDGKLIKLHGSYYKINPLEDTQNNVSDSIVSTLEALGQYAHLSLPGFKRDVFERIINKRHLFVIGYSGLDLLDVMQDLLKISSNSSKCIFWFEFSPGGPRKYVFTKTIASFRPNQFRPVTIQSYDPEGIDGPIETLEKNLPLEKWGVNIKQWNRKRFFTAFRTGTPDEVKYFKEIKLRKLETYFKSSGHALTFLEILLHWCDHLELAKQCREAYRKNYAPANSIIDSVNNACEFHFFHNSINWRFKTIATNDILNKIILREKNLYLKEIFCSLIRGDVDPKDLIWIPFSLRTNDNLVKGIEKVDEGTTLINGISQRIRELGSLPQRELQFELKDLKGRIDECICILSEAEKLHKNHGYLAYYYDCAWKLAVVYQLAGNIELSKSWFATAIDACEWQGEFGSILFIEREYAVASFVATMFRWAKTGGDLLKMLIESLEQIGKCAKKFSQTGRPEAVNDAKVRAIELCESASLLIGPSKNSNWEKIWRNEISQWQ
jgi:NAD-dependent SIR2 family protein deacetylase